MEETLKLVMITVITIGILYFILNQLFKILESIAKKGPDVIKSISILGGLIVVTWVFMNPKKANAAYKELSIKIQQKIKHESPEPAPSYELIKPKDQFERSTKSKI